MAPEDPLLGAFEPDPAAVPTNGSRLKGARGLSPGAITFGVLVGALVAVSAVSRVQWLNLARVGWWGRPVLAAVLAGAMVGWYRRAPRAAVAGGVIAALIALWGVYGMVRLSTRVIFVERSVVRVVTADLLRLAAYAVPGGAAGAAVPVALRAGIARMRDRRSRKGR